MHIYIDTHTWFLNSVFAHFDLAGELVGYMYDTALSDELTKLINELRRRVAELLAKPYGLQPSEKRTARERQTNRSKAGHHVMPNS